MSTLNHRSIKSLKVALKDRLPDIRFDVILDGSLCIVSILKAPVQMLDGCLSWETITPSQIKDDFLYKPEALQILEEMIGVVQGQGLEVAEMPGTPYQVTITIGKYDQDFSLI